MSKIIWIVLGSVMLTALAGCASGSATTAYPGWTRVHGSTLRQRPNNLDSNVALFAQGRLALIPGRNFGGPAKYLYLIDLDEGSRRQLDAPDVEVFEMQPAGDEVIVDGGTQWSKDSRPLGKMVHIVDSAGNVRRMRTLDLAMRQIGNEALVRSDRTQMEQARDAGELTGLAQLDVEVHQLDGSHRTMPSAFFNRVWYIGINDANDRDLAVLQPLAQGGPRFHHDPRVFTVPQLGGYRFEVQREPYYNYAGISSNERILRLRVWQGDRLLHDIKPRDFAYYALLRGRRLWLLGESADYVDLP